MSPMTISKTTSLIHPKSTPLMFLPKKSKQEIKVSKSKKGGADYELAQHD